MKRPRIGSATQRSASGKAIPAHPAIELDIVKRVASRFINFRLRLRAYQGGFLGLRLIDFRRLLFVDRDLLADKGEQLRQKPFADLSREPN